MSRHPGEAASDAALAVPVEAAKAEARRRRDEITAVAGLLAYIALLLAVWPAVARDK